MAEYIDSAVQTVLSSSRLKLAHPGNAKLTQVYPTPTECTSVLAQAVNHRGQFKASSNSKSFPGRSDFVISSSALLSEICLVGDIDVTNGPDTGLAPVVSIASAKPNNIGWIFNLVESIEITFSNSLMQNMIIDGRVLREYSLLRCCSKQERIDLLKGCGEMLQNPINLAANATNNYKFSLPLTFLFFASGSLRNSWPLDCSVLAGPMQISVIWRDFPFAFVANSVAVVANLAHPYLTAAQFPKQFKNLQMVAKTTQLQDASFGVKKAMMLNPQLVYSLPSKFLTTVDYSGPLTTGEQVTINLNSAPSGMLEGIIVTIMATRFANPAVNAGVFTGLANVQSGSAVFDKINLQFGGQYIFRADSYEEYLHYQRSNFGDTLETNNMYYTANRDSGAADSTLGAVEPLIFIPLVDDGSTAFRGHTNENLPSYGGSLMQLQITPAIQQRVGASDFNFNCPDKAGQDENEDNYLILVTYIISALVEISQGTVDLQL